MLNIGLISLVYGLSLLTEPDIHILRYSVLVAYIKHCIWLLLNMYIQIYSVKYVYVSDNLEIWDDMSFKKFFNYGARDCRLEVLETAVGEF